MKATFKKIWKKFWRPILHLSIFQWLIVSIIAMCIGVVYFTSRKQIDGYEIFRKYRRKPAIFVFWHGRSMMLAPIVIMGGIRSYAVTSRSKDGRMMARLLRLFGLRPIYGSTSAGAVSVLREGVRVLKDGKYSLCISPDGPSGPSLRVHEGAMYFAKMTGVPIIPACFSASRAWPQSRWDRYLIALPFSKIKVKIAKPIFIDRKISDADLEVARKSLEDFMVRQAHDLDAEFGHPMVEQDLKAGDFKKQKKAAAATRRAHKHKGRA